MSAPASRSGSRLSITMDSALWPANSPLSTNSTNPWPICSTTITSSACLPLVSLYLSALSVPAVARTPTTPVLVSAAAGFTAGSMPTKQIGYSFLNVAMAAAVAVLHATTMMSAP